MREALPKNRRILLHLASNPHKVAELELEDAIGSGANCIVYDAWLILGEKNRLPVRLKELFPVGASVGRLTNDSSVCWVSKELKENHWERFREASQKQLRIMSIDALRNSSVQAIDALYQGNDTLYLMLGSDHGVSYDKDQDNTLFDTIETCISIANATQVLHEHGLLHLDIKPENVLVIPETRQIVKLLDFDSIISKDLLYKRQGNVSFSYEYAAPELRRGMIAEIREATDVFSIGTVLFQRVIGRLPEADDMNAFSDWDFDALAKMKSASGRARRLLKTLLRRVLSTSPRLRMQTASEMADCLREIQDDLVHRSSFVVSNIVTSFETVLGRSEELKRIADMHKMGMKTVVVKGVGGIGKTSIVLAYIKEYGSRFDSVTFGRYQGSVRSFLMDQDTIMINGQSADEPSDWAARKALLKQAFRSDDLLVVDGFDGGVDDPDLSMLLNLPCRIMITTRDDLSVVMNDPTFVQTIHVGPIDERFQLDLLRRFHNKAVDDEEKRLYLELSKSVGSHTLFLRLFASNLQASGKSIRELHAYFSQQGLSGLGDARIPVFKDGLKRDTIAGHIESLFEMSGLSQEAKSLLKTATTLGKSRMTKGAFIKRCGGDTKLLNALNEELLERGWIDASDSIHGHCMHDLVRMVIMGTKAQGAEVNAAFLASISKEIDWVARNLALDEEYSYSLSFDDEVSFEYSYDTLENELSESLRLRKTAQFAMGICSELMHTETREKAIDFLIKLTDFNPSRVSALDAADLDLAHFLLLPRTQEGMTLLQKLDTVLLAMTMFIAQYGYIYAVDRDRKEALRNGGLELSVKTLLSLLKQSEPLDRQVLGKLDSAIRAIVIQYQNHDSLSLITHELDTILLQAVNELQRLACDCTKRVASGEVSCPQRLKLYNALDAVIRHVEECAVNEERMWREAQRNENESLSSKERLVQEFLDEYVDSDFNTEVLERVIACSEFSASDINGIFMDILDAFQLGMVGMRIRFHHPNTLRIAKDTECRQKAYVAVSLFSKWLDTVDENELPREHSFSCLLSLFSLTLIETLNGILYGESENHKAMLNFHRECFKHLISCKRLRIWPSLDLMYCNDWQLFHCWLGYESEVFSFLQELYGMAVAAREVDVIDEDGFLEITQDFGRVLSYGKNTEYKEFFTKVTNDALGVDFDVETD